MGEYINIENLKKEQEGLQKVDLEKEIEQFEEALHGFDSVTSDDCKTIARHFFELGLNAVVPGRKESGEWETLRRKAAARILAGMVANKVYRAHPDDNSKSEIKEQKHAAKRAAYTAVVYADALVRQLQSLGTSQIKF